MPVLVLKSSGPYPASISGPMAHAYDVGIIHMFLSTVISWHAELSARVEPLNYPLSRRAALWHEKQKGQTMYKINYCMADQSGDICRLATIA